MTARPKKAGTGSYWSIPSTSSGSEPPGDRKKEGRWWERKTEMEESGLDSSEGGISDL